MRALDGFLRLVHRARLVVFALVGVAMLAFGVGNAWTTAQLVRDGDHVSGRVVDTLRSTADGETSHRAIVAYEVDGEEHRVTLDRTHDTSPVGERRDLLVARDRADGARADSFGELWLSTIVLFTIGVLALAAVAWVAWGRAWLRARRGR